MFVLMRAMGLDVGTKTVGVAISDELGLTAQGVPTVRRQNLKQDLAALATLAEEHGVTVVVVGLPLNMDGSEGPRAEASRAFGALVTERLGLPVEYWDERLTTVEAQRVLLAADVSRQKRKQVIDQLAAGLILQGWLDARRGTQHDGDDELDP
jgi:putative holliday junction resolvase